jgi:hypothetical protein
VAALAVLLLLLTAVLLLVMPAPVSVITSILQWTESM